MAVHPSGLTPRLRLQLTILASVVFVLSLLTIYHFNSDTGLYPIFQPSTIRQSCASRVVNDLPGFTVVDQVWYHNKTFCESCKAARQKVEVQGWAKAAGVEQDRLWHRMQCMAKTNGQTFAAETIAQ